jgi:CRISPR-associated exonuclease Cas4
MKITPTELLEYNFCPRFIYFMNVLKIPQYEKRRYKVQIGLTEHEKRLKSNIDYLWKKIGVINRESNVQLESEKYHLRGLIDDVVTLEDNSMAPVDFKFVPYQEYTFKSHKIQILTYCLLIEEIYATEVKNGYIFYIRGGSKQVTIPFNESAKKNIITDVEGILTIMREEKMPGATPNRNKCIDCTYKNICIR